MDADVWNKEIIEGLEDNSCTYSEHDTPSEVQCAMLYGCLVMLLVVCVRSLTPSLLHSLTTSTMLSILPFRCPCLRSGRIRGEGEWSVNASAGQTVSAREDQEETR